MLLLSTISFLVLCVFNIGASTKEEVFEVAYGYANGDASTYYSSVDETKLLSSLRTINNNRLKSRVGYDDMPGAFVRTDPGTSSGTVMGFYSGKSAKYNGNMNREHVWPASKTVGGRGNDPLEDDIHMVRPTFSDDNSDRGNSFFTYSYESGWDPGSLDDETYRGDAARIIFYCVVADSRLSLVDKNYDASSNHTMGKLSDLLEWNLMYPVKQREKTRNEAAESLQGNRNPFIDHPEYACKIWGNANSKTKSICERAELKPESISFSTKAIELEVGEEFSLVYEIEPQGAFATLNWESTYEDVATVSSGLVTALKPGETTICVSIDGTSLYDTCKVTVKGDTNEGNDEVEDDTPTNQISVLSCGGNIVITSITLSSISLLGVGLLYLSGFLRKKNEKK